MTSDNRHHRLQESHHGVLLNIAGNGVLIIGGAGIGKSSLALDYLHNGHSLIADDCIDFKINNNLVTGYCPPMLAGLLHTRELGLITVTDAFGSSALQANISLDYVIHLRENTVSPSSLSIEPETYCVCEQLFPQLTLDVNNPATLHNRIATWLILQTKSKMTTVEFCQRQRAQMSI